MHKIAMIQKRSCLSVGVNPVTAKRLVVEAASQGAKIAILPDYLRYFRKKVIIMLLTKKS